MKIVHIAPTSPYNDYWGYQDNLLPKYHRILGHEVTVIVSNHTHQGSEIVETECADYKLIDGTRVIKLKKKQYFHRIVTNLNSKIQVFSILSQIKPDFIFFHGLISTSIFDCIKYKKKIKQNCVIVQDNHMDYFNSAYGSKGLKNKFIRGFYRIINKRSQKYVEKVYGVTPWRKQFAEEYYKISPLKTDILLMGADDEEIDFLNRENIKAKIREENNIQENEFLIVTGGKIDKNKNICQLMSACSHINGVKLLVFGNVSDDIKEEFEAALKESENIIYIGWISSDKVYNYFLAADLVVFPGTHSVLWEQACACKVPCLFEKWEGMEHVNNGGNSRFIYPVDKYTLKTEIEKLLFTQEYQNMKKIAQSDATDIFLYSKIAEKSLECSTDNEF